MTLFYNYAKHFANFNSSNAFNQAMKKKEGTNSEFRLDGESIKNVRDMVEFYEHKISDEGLNYKTLLYSGPAAHEERMRAAATVLETLVPDKSCEISELGCGYGALIPFLSEYPNYFGYDAVPHFIESAKEKFPGRNFQSLDILDSVIPRRDVVVAAGVISSNPDPLAFIQRSLALAKRVCIFDFIIETRLPIEFAYLNSFSMNEIMNVVRENGFNFVYCLDYGRPWVVYGCRKG